MMAAMRRPTGSILPVNRPPTVKNLGNQKPSNFRTLKILAQTNVIKPHKNERFKAYCLMFP